MCTHLGKFLLGIVILVAASCYAGEQNGTVPACSEDPSSCPAEMVCNQGHCEPKPAPKCGESLAFVGPYDFSIRFKLATTAKVQSTIMFQRTSCDATHDLWDLQLLSTGLLRFEMLEAGATYQAYAITRIVNDGQHHNVWIRRVGGVLISEVDGQLSGYMAAPQKLGDLPALGVATGDPCEVTGDVKPLAGTISEICITVEFPEQMSRANVRNDFWGR